MSTQPSQHDDFGANEWLVYEIQQQYLQDPGSVSPEWREFFADLIPPAGNGSTAAPAAPAAESTAVDPAPAPIAPAPIAPAAGRAHTAPAPAATATTFPLKGASARVVANMESSLDVPTATSVRAVPAKLLADNRTVINNHLRRARGGKVSFTHLIGYALVRAVADVPVMNNSYAEIAGKPVLSTPAHVGLGLAIDLHNANGTRSLVVAAIKGADTMDFAAYWTAYEDIVRRARNGKLGADDEELARRCCGGQDEREGERGRSAGHG